MRFCKTKAPQGTPLFPFGFGLSYSTFSLAAKSDKLQLDSAGSVTLDITVAGCASQIVLLCIPWRHSDDGHDNYV